MVHRLLTALQANGIEALQVPKFVAVDLVEIVLELLSGDKVALGVGESEELLAMEDAEDIAELLDMIARWT